MSHYLIVSKDGQIISARRHKAADPDQGPQRQAVQEAFPGRDVASQLENHLAGAFLVQVYISENPQGKGRSGSMLFTWEVGPGQGKAQAGIVTPGASQALPGAVYQAALGFLGRVSQAKTRDVMTALILEGVLVQPAVQVADPDAWALGFTREVLKVLRAQGLIKSATPGPGRGLTWSAREKVINPN